MENYYEILGVPEDASPEEIKRAFRELAKKYHPDRGGDPVKFKKILEAYRVLSDPKLRQEYDQKRKFAHTFTGFDFDFDFEDLLSQFFGKGGLTDIFETIFTGKTSKFKKDIVQVIQIPLAKAYQGTEAKVSFKRLVQCAICYGTGARNKELITCQNCQGTGRVRDRRSFWSSILFEEVKTCPSCQGIGRVAKEKCLSCGGKGLVEKTEEVSVQIPPGFREKELRIPGLGNQDRQGRSGDLVIKLVLQVEPPFSLENGQLIYHAKINFLDALLGSEIEIPLYGQIIKLKLPAGVLPGEIFRISGKGLAGGDLYVKIQIIPPKKLTPKAKKLIEELKKELS